MVIVDELPPTLDEFDYIIVGGGTAGCVIASRLAENLPDKSILVIEGGGSDVGDERILSLKGMVDLWGGDFDYKYASVPQDFGTVTHHFHDSRMPLTNSKATATFFTREQRCWEGAQAIMDPSLSSPWNTIFADGKKPVQKAGLLSRCVA